MSVSLRSEPGAQRTFPGREIEQSGYWKFEVDMSIVRIDSPLFLSRHAKAVRGFVEQVTIKGGAGT
jgi:hypothetical protein